MAVLALVAARRPATAAVTPPHTPVVPGDTDTTFGAGGEAMFELGTQPNAAGTGDFALLPDGRMLVPSWGNADYSLVVQRLLPNGGPDPAYGQGGAVTIPDQVTPTSSPNPHLVATADGGAVILLYGRTAELIRLDANGVRDPAWGVANLPLGLFPTAVAVTPDDRVLVAGSYGPTVDPSRGAVVELTSSGQVDPSFGSGGMATVPVPGKWVSLTDIAVAQNGSIAVRGTAADATGADLVFAMLEASGQPAVGFGGGGPVVVDDPTAIAAGGLAFSGDRLFAALNHQVSDQVSASVVRFDTTGAVDPTFGGPSGQPLTPAAPVRDLRATNMTAAGDGTLVVAGLGLIPPNLAQTGTTARTNPFIERVDPSGAPPAAVVTTNVGGGGGAVGLAVSTSGSVVVSSDGPAYLFETRLDGSLDTSFGTAGAVHLGLQRDRSEDVDTMVTEPDGSVVIAGRSARDGFVLKDTRSGALDTTFGTGGFTLVPGRIAAELEIGKLIRLSDGRLVAIGTLRDVDTSVIVVRLSADGQLDPTFGDHGRTLIPQVDFGTFPQTIPVGGAADAEGRILVFGDGYNGTRLTRLNPDGTPDATWGQGGTMDLPSEIHAQDLAVNPSDGIIIAGHRHRYPDNTGLVLAYRPDGTPDPSFGAGGVDDLPTFGTVSAVVALADGRLLVDGPRPPKAVPPGSRLTRLTASGLVDSTFGVDGFAAGFADAVGPPVVGDGYIHLTSGDYLERLSFDGTPDKRYNDYATPHSYGLSFRHALAVDGEGRVLLATTGVHTPPEYGITYPTVVRFVGGTLPPEPSVSVDDAAVAEGDTGSTDLVIPVHLSTVSPLPVHIEVSISPGTAQPSGSAVVPIGPEFPPGYNPADLDWLGCCLSRSVDIPPGQTVGTVRVPIIADKYPEPDETVIASISSADWATIGRSAATGTIVNDDGPIPPSTTPTAPPTTTVPPTTTPVPPTTTPQPSAPTSVVVAPHPGAVTASWSPPASAGASPVLGYAVIAVGRDEPVRSEVVAADVRSVSVLGLADGRPVTVYVVAWSAAGAGSTSAPVSATPAATAPVATPARAPTVDSAVLGNGFALVTWRPPTSDGGAPIRKYAVLAADHATGAVTASRVVTADVRTASLVGLTAGRVYDVYVVAATATANGGTAPGRTAGPVRPTTAPMAAATPTPPSWVIATPARASIAVQWGPAAERGHPVTGYAVVITQPGRAPVSATVNGDTRAATLTGLSPGVPADVYVVAGTNAGPGQVPAPVRVTPTP